VLAERTGGVAGAGRYISPRSSAYVLLAVIACGTVFGLCVTALTVREVVTIAPKTLSRLIDLRDPWAERDGYLGDG
jgi:hypothetical protein